jgi:WhiB family redox-sensing transcriptional regulator
MMAAHAILFSFDPDEDLSWQDKAECRGLSPSVFFPDKGDNSKVLKSICGGCPVKAECLEHGIKYKEWGSWGGLSEKQLKRLRRRRAQAAMYDEDRRHARSL